MLIDMRGHHVMLAFDLAHERDAKINPRKQRDECTLFLQALVSGT